MLTHYVLGRNAALRAVGIDKIAASRLDREVRKGTVGYQDVVPQATGTDAQKMVRDAVHAPTPQPEEAVARWRQLQGARFRNEHLLAERARALPANARMPGQQDYAQLFKDDGGLGARAMPNGNLFVPETSGQSMRHIGAENSRFLALSPEERDKLTTEHVNNMFSGVKTPEAPLPTRAPVDDTLNMSTMMHEKAEREALRSNRQYSHATHAGVEPILQEQHVLRGDTEAQQVMRGNRLDTDNALVARLSRQVGAHPDNPLPVGGKHQKALERRLESNAHKLDKDTLRSNINSLESHYMDSKKPFIATVPHEARGLLKDMAAIRQNAPEGFLKRMRYALKAVPEQRRLRNALEKFTG